MSQYAEVVPNTKTDLLRQTFTYKIPPEILARVKTGSLVYIPFGKRKIEGIIIKISRKTNKIIKEKIKSIFDVIQTDPVIDNTRYKLAKWMSEYYLASFSLCLFEMIALPPKRKISQKIIKDTRLDKQPPTKIYSAVSIINLCQRALAKNKRVMVIFPEINLSRAFMTYLKKKFKKIVLYHGQLNTYERYNAFQTINAGKADIVCGSRLALFTPLSRLGLIVVYDEHSESYKNERAPRYNLKTVAENLAKLTSSKLVFLSPAPSIESYFKARQKRFYLSRPSILLSQPHHFVKIIDMASEIKKGNYSQLSDTLRQFLTKTIERRGQSILFIGRRGAASYIFCSDCGYILRCPNCEQPLVYHFSNKSSQLDSQYLLCHHCSFKIKPFTLCPRCQGINLKYWGPGTQRIETEIKKMFIKPQILRIDKDFPDSLSHSTRRYDFIIGTQKLLSNWFRPVELVAVIAADSVLNLPDFHQGEKFFSILTRLRYLSKKFFVVQTHQPDNFIIKTATKGDYLNFYNQELGYRKKLDFPPFSKLIRLIIQNKKEQKCQIEAEFLADKLKLIIAKNSIPVSVLGPSPCFYRKIRGKFRWQIVLKSAHSQRALSPINQLLKTLPKDWIVDVEPITLL